MQTQQTVRHSKTQTGILTDESGSHTLTNTTYGLKRCGDKTLPAYPSSLSSPVVQEYPTETETVRARERGRGERK